ncbi:SusC/RagA family TonB-linked outer membrane protein [Salegentibacter mishustinae]|uniref:SusC/RagA family TonB-linked outer membrane protein n=1 Tax=Salegentibacter mishustinae TaxID=270918 RepID=A0A0Q9Z8B5_9FLAO|nr:TonB-dependent receptor [Salegentibacter mishustinae]KRG28265.1 SusC/RagA family TonB-linked outer membrane protein [Salegentibacter mishustinae]PNW22200.1 SusC/RagA family TonB-linked outer membrane protein [Salegentibacter mishustinae]PZX67419.1 TonB-linked SusC/RagA family outer membrane protein [Salegentibacter mishustinae]GGW79871.1 SusC/RagA family TonB-linked outer membrane protein [Salegentibacter mishustinae]
MKLKLSFFLFLLLCANLITAQEIQVTGNVTTAEEGMPLLGATVSVKGTSTGTSTDFDGNYSIDGVSPDATLVFTFVGYKQTEVPVDGRTTIDVVMEADAALLDQVVLTGYSRERKVDVTGAITVVDVAPIEGQSRSSGNAMQALQGRVPGLFVEKSGDPTGASSRVLIRGVTTLGNNDPLYVIDGVPTQRQEVFSSLNPDAIESIQVLKDASASSLYGARAGNGVIVVTTKNSSGSAEKVSVSYNSNFSVQSEKQQRYDMLNAVQRGQALWRASVNDGADPASGYGEIYNFDWNMDYDNPILNGVSVQPFVGGDENVPVGDTDWQDELYEVGYVYNNELTVSANSEKSSFFVNLGHLKNTGILKHTNYERYTAKINANTKLFDDKVRFGVNTQFSTSDETLAAQDVGGAPTPGLAISLAPTIPVYDANGDFAGPLGAGYSDRNNPLLMQYLNRWDNAEKNNFFGNIYAEVDLMENLTFRTSLGIDFSDFKRKDIEPRVNNGFITRSNNRLTFDTNKYTSVVFTNTLNYKLELDNHEFGVLLGLESVKNDFDSVIARADDFAVEQESYFVLDAATGARTSNGSSSGNRLLSQFGKLNYSFDNRYLASVTVRRDGSSRFGENNRYGVFPAVTAGWRISNEKFLKNNETITNLKLRAGYGEVGNQSIGDLARFGLYESRYGPTLSQFTGGFFEQYYNIGTAYDINGNGTGNLPSGFVSVQAENPDLKWETTKEWNFGVDFGLFNNSLSGSFDYFTRETVDILTTPPIPSVLGEGQQRVLNGASTQTRGWEFALNYSNTLENGLTFSVSTNFSSFKDEITFLPEEVRPAFPGTAENSILGHSQFSIFGYETDGLFQSEEDIANSPEQVGARPGSLKFKDLNNDGVIDTDDRDFIGTTLPDLEYGIRIDLGYRNWDFSVFGSGVTGRIGQDPYIFWNNFVQGRENAGMGVLDAWTPNNTGSTIPSLSLAFNDLRTSDYLFRNNSYFKIRNMQLGYTLSDGLIEKLAPLQNFRIYLQGENLFWFTPEDYIGSDPERTDVNRIPVPTVVSVGLNINF